MDERSLLSTQVHETLEKGTFEVSERCNKPSCFDLLARRNVLLLVFKILANIDSINEMQAKNMLYLSRAMVASPILIGRRTRIGELEEGVVYERYGLLAISPETLEDILINHILPLIFSARGGFYVKIDGEVLRKVREERNISLGELAGNIGVSRRMISRYEGGCAGATFETAMRMEEYLDEFIVKPIEIFFIPKNIDLSNKELNYEKEMPMLNRLVEIGFKVYPIEKAPFDAITKDEENVLLTKIAKIGFKGMERRAAILKSISDTVKRDAFFIIESGKTYRSNLGGIPAVKKGELERMEEPEELVETLYKRKR